MGDPLCDRPEVGRGGALLWSVAELRLVAFGFGVFRSDPRGVGPPKPPQSSSGVRVGWADRVGPPVKNFGGPVRTVHEVTYASHLKDNRMDAF